MENVEWIAKRAKKAAPTIARATLEERNEALLLLAEALQTKREYLLDENQQDITEAKQKGTAQPLIDRLLLTEERIADMAEGMRQLVALPDPINQVLETMERPNGLLIEKRAVPFGVFGMIYEARPNVTVDACALAIKTGNGVVLRGSGSAMHSNKAIVSVLKEALRQTSIHTDIIQLIENPSREEANRFMKLKGDIDVLIPRGGASLIQTVVNEATIPVIETGVGNCHVYLSNAANVELASAIIVNAKTQRPSVCNACETVLVERSFAEQHLHTIAENLRQKGVQLVGDETAQALHPQIGAATEEDWQKEYLDLSLAVRCVDGIEEAVAHIEKYGTNHSEAIVTEDDRERDFFFQAVDAAVLYHNASTRFTDGFEFGFGAEIGISTQKLHARGPMGLHALTTYKYTVKGSGQIKG
ncbi:MULTISPECIES: glutamate-5-semialdehyde dehydrogenase [Shouchella]|uniref:Gamma-glutamyl phosphate reductase n=1 Tax=Shouchella hunanensis TaxID=766894 RepID=A0ABY7W1H2_9BACI|nr:MULTISPECIES: glutamate-5-semialdehyde dehydrogenase [Shouchella]WDF02798.1 glutamate-5-semialdehyde dehydrogenase [Shouchella hunanensis]